MNEAGFAILMLLVLAWAVLSNLLATVNITGPLVLLVAGYLLGNPPGGRWRWTSMLPRSTCWPR